MISIVANRAGATGHSIDGKSAWVIVPGWTSSKQLRSAYCKQLLADNLSYGVELNCGWLWLPADAFGRYPFISPAVKPRTSPREVPASLHLKEATCPGGHTFDPSHQLHVQAKPPAGVSGYMRAECSTSGGSLAVQLHMQVAVSALGCQLSIRDLVGSYLPDGKLEKLPQKALLGMEINIRATLHTTDGEAHLPLWCPLTSANRGHVPLSLVQLPGISALNTARLQQEQGTSPTITRKQEPLGEDGLVHDVYLSACPAVSSQHSAFKLARSPASSFALCSSGLADGRPGVAPFWGQALTELQLRQQIWADNSNKSFAETPVQMSATLPTPLVKNSVIMLEVQVKATLGQRLTRSQQLRAGTCSFAALPEGATGRPWLLTEHLLQLGEAWATRP